MPSEAPASPHALVTGSSSGIGLAIARHLLEQGWRVSGWDLAAPVLQQANFTPVSVDLMDENAIAQALQRQPPVTALVHAAGWMRTAPLGALDLQAGEAMWRLHVQSATQLAQALVPAMASHGLGRVVLIGSRVAQGMAGRSQYAAVKAALIAMARSWAAEVAASGVTVNVVSPAATQTAMLSDPARVGSAPQLPPIGRYIDPAEVAALVSFLLSSQAAAITGQDLQICGGASLPR
ncbi:SDR family oxidoreductase [Polaromonas sp. P2-4]|nr:SDR family oxidoreductase [Polaromonas sp. P2-4]